MHHTLKLYFKHREGSLKFYMFWAKWTKLPLIGTLVRRVANAYGSNVEGAYVLTTDEAEAIVDSAEGVAAGEELCWQWLCSGSAEPWQSHCRMEWVTNGLGIG